MNKSDLVFYDNYPSIAYAPKEGVICRVNKDKEFIRKLIPDENGMLNIFALERDAFTNRKAINLAYEIFNKKAVPEGYLVYPKDADENNIKANNLGLMSKQEYVKYKDAIDNVLNEKLKLTFGAGKHKVRYKHLGRTKVKKFDDATSANTFKKQVYLESIKMISKFFVNG
jgi:hypothetical protein